MQDLPTHPPFVQPGDLLTDFLRNFWQRQVDAAEQETPDFRHPPLPLARIKKVMKSDPDVKMIAADAPILFCKACEIFIAEITARAFIVADSNKRRTLSRADIAKALAKSDQFDFLIDIVPREEGFPGARKAASAPGASTMPGGNAGAGAGSSHVASGGGSGAGVGGHKDEESEHYVHGSSQAQPETLRLDMELEDGRRRRSSDVEDVQLDDLQKLLNPGGSAT